MLCQPPAAVDGGMREVKNKPQKKRETARAMVREYFAHDHEARHDIKIVALRAELGARGYGVH